MTDGGSDVSSTMVEAMKDCCNGLATFEHTGQSCKSAQIFQAGADVAQLGREDVA